MIVRGTTETRDELTGNFGSALEDASISDYRLIALFAEKTLNAIFGVLQHYPPINGHRKTDPTGPFRANRRHQLSGLRRSVHSPNPNPIDRFSPSSSTCCARPPRARPKPSASRSAKSSEHLRPPNAPTISETHAMPNPKSIML